MTVQMKQIAKGSIIKIGPTTGITAEYGRVETFDMPVEEYETLEVPELNPQDDDGNALDTDPTELGDEIYGEFSFTHYWDPRHTDATTLRGYFTNKTELDFEVVTPHTTSATISWTGKIKSLTIPTLEKNGYYKRTVTGIRTSAITEAATA